MNESGESNGKLSRSPRVLRTTRRGTAGAGHRLVFNLKPSRRRLWLIILAAVVLAVAAGIAVGFHFYYKDKIQVADLSNWKIEDARLWVKSNGLILREDEKYDDKAEVGRVMAQELKKGAWIAKKSFIGVTVSKGPDPSVQLPLPDLIAMTKDDIDAWVKQNALTQVEITAQYHDTVIKGEVISFEIGDPSVVDKVKRSTPIHIIVSKGRQNPDDAAIPLPDFYGKPLDDCIAFANKNGINLQIGKEYSDLIATGAIIRQSVKVGAKMKPGDALAVTVSLGKAVLVPDFSGFTKQDAASEAQKLNIAVSVTERYSATPSGALISQSIAPKTIYTGGQSVSLVYSLGDQVSVGNFVGQSQSAIETWARGVNGQGASIKIKTTYTQSSAAKDRILFQDKQNTAVGLKATISITVSQGMRVQVPEFVAPAGSGYSVAVTMEKAMAMCEKLGIVPVFVESKKSGRLPGEVWYQSVAAGKRISQGATITLKYTPNTTVVSVPDFTGMTKQEILDAGYDMKLDITFTIASTHVDGFYDEVYRQTITSGTQVASGSAITLTVSPSPSP